MSKVEGSYSQTVVLPAALPQVYEFFANPDKLRMAQPDVDDFTLLDPQTARWQLAERVEGGVRFAADYTVKYTGNGSDQVSWRSQGEGNMDVRGSVTLRATADGHTEVDYEETCAPDMPITKLLVMIFRPLVAREVSNDIKTFLSQIQAHFEAGK